MDYEVGHSGQKDLLGAEAWGGKCGVCFVTTRPALELHLRALESSDGQQWGMGQEAAQGQPVDISKCHHEELGSGGPLMVVSKV